MDYSELAQNPNKGENSHLKTRSHSPIFRSQANQSEKLDLNFVIKIQEKLDKKLGKTLKNNSEATGVSQKSGVEISKKFKNFDLRYYLHKTQTRYFR